MADTLQHSIAIYRKNLESFFTTVLENLSQVGRAFLNDDLDLAEKVVARYGEIEENFLHHEQEFVKIIALYQPFAKDLRRLMAFYKISQDMERISALVVKIGKKTIKVADKVDSDRPKDFRDQIHHICEMLENTIRGISKSNPKLMSKVIEDRQTARSLKTSLKKQIESLFVSQPEKAKFFINVLGVSRHLDRIADLCSTMCQEFVEI